MKEGISSAYFAPNRHVIQAIEFFWKVGKDPFSLKIDGD
jgi:hypothetical protein